MTRHGGWGTDIVKIDVVVPVVPGLWALGPIVRGVFWESVAVPDIRVQAAALAETIGASAIHAFIARDRENLSGFRIECLTPAIS